MPLRTGVDAPRLERNRDGDVTTERIGIYGGTFDPVHTGHLILARDAVELLGLARLIFVPAAISPHKLGRAPGASGADRLAMLQAAVADEPAFEVDALELDRPGPSYTFDTVAVLQARRPDARWHYLIGADNVPDLSTWHRVDELRARVQFVVFHRHALTPPAPETEDLPTLRRVVDLSSTEIRNRVASGRSIRYLVPESVREFIDARHLYRQPPLNP